MKQIRIGIGHNSLAPNVSEALAAAATKASVPFRVIDLETVRVEATAGGLVSDRQGEIGVSHLAPALLYWREAAALAYRAMEASGVQYLNSVSASELADDKARTALTLSAVGIPQVESVVVGQEAQTLQLACEEIGFPCIVKRTHGAQGRWVRLAETLRSLPEILGDFGEEGPGAIVVQRFVSEFRGRSIRVIVTGGQVLAAALRQGAPGALISNISAGGKQTAVQLTAEEASISLAATAALGLGHAGVDLVRTQNGPAVLEVNACPDFTSMEPLERGTLTDRVLSHVVERSGTA